jgi:GNAT superfamily N-acetyltransferase
LSGPRGGAVMEIGQAVVAPAHRGRGVLKDLMDLLMGEARRRGLAGLYTHCVTIHPFSQRALFNYGFRESAVLLGYAHRHVRMKEFADLELPQRETVIFGYQSLDGERRRPVYPPAHHRPIISRIYQNLGLERELVLCQESHTGIEREVSHFEVTTRLAPAFGFGLIEVASYGPGIEQEVKNKLGDVCHEPTAVVYLNLPITEPETAVLCHRFEGLGFFFSGIQPRPDGRDLLCLQMLNGPRVDYDLLQIHSDFGRELVAYVRDADPLA